MATRRPSTPPASSGAARAPLPPTTPEQVRQLEIGRIKAKALREQREDEAATNTSLQRPGKTVAGQKRPYSTVRDGRGAADRPLDTIRPARNFAKYVEYDFNKMTDTKGGFLTQEDDSWNKAMYGSDKADARPEHMTQAEWERQQLATRLRSNKAGPFEPGISASAAQEAQTRRCRECGTLEVDWKWVEVFGLAVCHGCKDRHADKYSLLTKSEAREDYLLTEPELKDTALLPHLEKANPHKSTWATMFLYLRCQVEEYAFSERRWGSAEALDAEFERRSAEKKRRKEAKFKSKLADLKKRTRHDFGRAVDKGDPGVTVKTERTMAWQSGPGAGAAAGGPMAGEQPGGVQAYTLQGVMRFLQTEWHRHERDRNAWEIEREEMKKRIAGLEGEARTGRGLRLSLEKNVKLLEMALKKEREKVKSLAKGDGAVAAGELGRDAKEVAREELAAAGKEKERDKSKSFLSKCVSEVTYHILPASHIPPAAADALPSSREPELKPAARGGQPANALDAGKTPLYDDDIEAVSHSYDAYGRQVVPPAEPLRAHAFPSASALAPKSPPRAPGARRKSSGARRRSDGSIRDDALAKANAKAADLSQFKIRFAMRGHLDVVRAVIFTGGGSPSEPEFCTASDDGGVKRWHIPASYTHVSATGDDLDRIAHFTHRGHVGAVCSLAACPASAAFSNGGRVAGDGWIFSGGEDATVRVWERGRVDAKAILDGHKDAVWALCVLPGTAGSILGERCSHFGGPDRLLLAAGGADGTILIWAVSQPPQLSSPLGGPNRGGARGSRRANSISAGSNFPSSPQPSVASSHPFHYALVHRIERQASTASPTSISPLSASGESLVVSYADASVVVFDVRTGEEIVGMASLETYDGTPNTGVNIVVANATGFDTASTVGHGRRGSIGDDDLVHGATGSEDGVEGVVIAGYEDRFIRFFDANSGQCTYTMLAHPSAISALSLSPDGRELVSGGHDASLRFWSLEKRSCIQEITSHRIMRGEGVCAVVWSPDGRWVISCGGDGIVNFFHHPHHGPPFGLGWTDYTPTRPAVSRQRHRHPSPMTGAGSPIAQSGLPPALWVGGGQPGQRLLRSARLGPATREDETREEGAPEHHPHPTFPHAPSSCRA
ncbi:hypothetical protein DV737_g2479, partial [Chaetothyriales sp. CBS 132003]